MLDDSVTILPPSRTRRLTERVEAAFGIDREHAVEVRVAHLRHRGKVHDAGVGDHDIDAAERLFVFVEESADRHRVTDVSLDPDRPPAPGLDVADDLRGQIPIDHTVDGDRITVVSQSPRGRGADAAGRARDDG